MDEGAGRAVRGAAGLSAGPIGLKGRTRAPFPAGDLPVVNPPAFSSRLHGPMARLTAAVVEITGPPDLRDRLRRAGDGDLPDDQADELGRELDLLAGLLASGR